MKLIIQIPCYNEEKTLPATVADLPRKIDGIDTIEYLIIDDGSTDKTIEVAKEVGVHHIVKQPQNKGLAKGFMTGIDACLKLGADIIVNTDGDNQYCGHDIPLLIEPILAGEAEVVVGDRQTDTIIHFSPIKKRLQKLGSWVVRIASKSEVVDTTSGFRAYTRDAAMHLNVISDYSYTLETIISTGQQKIAISNVKIRTNKVLRKSRLFKSIGNYIRRSTATIIRTYAQVRALTAFLIPSGIFIVIGAIFLVRYLFYYFNGDGAGHVQSILAGIMFLIIGFLLAMFGMLADAIASNRKVNEELLYRIKKMEYEKYETGNES